MAATYVCCPDGCYTHVRCYTRWLLHMCAAQMAATHMCAAITIPDGCYVCVLPRWLLHTCALLYQMAATYVCCPDGCYTHVRCYNYTRWLLHTCALLYQMVAIHMCGVHSICYVAPCPGRRGGAKSDRTYLLSRRLSTSLPY